MRDWSVAVQRVISEERGGELEFDISSASSRRSWARVLISNAREKIALGGVIEQKRSSRSGTLNDLTLDPERSLQFGNSSTLPFKLITLSDVAIAGVGDGFGCSGRAGELLEQIHKIIRKITNNQMHGEISVLISKRSAAAADQVKK